MAWNNLVFAFQSQLTSLKLNQLHGNFGATAEGESGAPRMTRAAAPWPVSVSDNKIKTSEASTSGSVSSSLVLITLNARSFFPNLNQADPRSAFDDSPVIYTVTGTNNTTADTPRFRIVSLGGGSVDYYIGHRYIG